MDSENESERPPSRTRPSRNQRYIDVPTVRTRTVSAQSAAAEREAVTARRAITPSPGQPPKPTVFIPPLPPLPRMPGGFVTSTPRRPATAPGPGPTSSPPIVTRTRTPPLPIQSIAPPPPRPSIAPRNFSEPAVRPSNTSARPSMKSNRPTSMTDDSDSSYMSAYSHSPSRTFHSLPGDDDDDEIDEVLGSGATIAEVLLQDHHVVRDQDSPVLASVFRERSKSDATSSTAEAANRLRRDGGSPTVSDYSTHSTNTTRMTSPTVSTDSKHFPIPA